MRKYLLFGVTLALLLITIWAIAGVVFAADPAPQSIQGSRSLEVLSGVASVSDYSWESTEAGFYGVADVYYSLAISTTAKPWEVVTVTLKHSPDCVGLWENYVTATYTQAQMVTAGTVFTRVVNYGGCLAVDIDQDATNTTQVTSSLSIVLKNN